MTYSIIARDPGTGHIGLAVASRFFAAGGAVPYTAAATAIATQAFLNPLYGIEGLPRLAAGEPAAAVIADFTARDGNAAQRQVHMLDAAGDFAAFTGEGCVDWAGHVAGTDCSVAGNMLAGPNVVADTCEAFERGRGLRLPERLLAAMEAGERAGGDKRGRQSAALRVHRGEDYAWINIRADDHADPLAELRRLMAVAEERYLHFVEALATRANFDPRGQLMKNPWAAICSDAALAQIKDGTPVYETIAACTDIRKFVCVIKAEGGATWRDGANLGKTVRFYWSEDGDPIIKLKPHKTTGSRPKIPDTDGARPVMDLPDELPDDIDHRRYELEAATILKGLGFHGAVIHPPGGKRVRITKKNKSNVLGLWAVAP